MYLATSVKEKITSVEIGLLWNAEWKLGHVFSNTNTTNYLKYCNILANSQFNSINLCAISTLIQIKIKKIVHRCNSHLPVRPGYFTWYLSGSETRCRKEILSSPIWPTKHYLRYVQRHTNILCYRDDALTHQCVADTHASKCKIDVVSATYFKQLWTINGLKSLSRLKLIW